jgi:flagella basal body P-ring formation protein FlgA
MTSTSLLLIAALAASTESAVPSGAVTEGALVAAVQARMGSVGVTVTDLATSVVPGAGPDVVALPVAGARVGGPVRFALFQRGPVGRRGAARRVGSATAMVRVSAVHARAARAIARGTELGEADLTVVREDVGSVPMNPLPPASDLIGARAVRDLRAGEVILPALAAPPVLVRSGDRVDVRVIVDGIEARGEAVAAESGCKGEIIRLSNPVSRRTIRGRVIGRGEVEVVR